MATSTRSTPINSGYTILNGTSTGKNDDRFDVWVEYKVTSQSIANNASTIKAYFYAALKSGESSSTKQNSGLDSTFSVGGTAGTAVKDGSYDFTSASKINALGSFSGDIKHNSDGTKTVTFSGSFTTESDYIAGGSISKSVTLKTIARASVPTVSTLSPNMGSSFTIYTNRKSTSFTHTITYSFAGKTGTVASDVAASCTWTPPYSLAKQIPTKTSEACVLTCKTYNGSTLIGTETKDITLKVPNNSSTKPKVSVVVAPTTIDVSTLSSFGGRTMPAIYLQGKNKLKATITASSDCSNIKTYYVDVDGMKKEGSSSEVTTQTFATSGDKTVTIRVTDERGYYTEITQKIYVYPYTKPSVLSLSTLPSIVCERYDAGKGEVSESGTSLLLRVRRSYSKVVVNEEQKNFCALWYRYRESGASYDSSGNDWLKLKELTDDDVFDGVVTTINLDSQKSYEVQLRAYDLVMGNDVVTIPIPTAQTDLNLNNNKAAFGKYAEIDNALEIVWDIYDKYATQITNNVALISSPAHDPNTTLESVIATNVNTPTTNWYYIQTIFRGEKDESVNKLQIAYPYASVVQPPAYRYYYDGKWSEWMQLRRVNDIKDISTALTASSAARELTKTITYDEATKTCYMRAYFVNDVAMTSGTTVDVGTIDSQYKPSYTHALSHYATKNCSAMINTSGVIRIMPRESVGTGYSHYITGWWTL